MIPNPVAVGHVLMLAGVLAGLYGLWQLAVMLGNRGHERGTPQYARARDGRRHAVWSIAAGALLYLAGCFTPLSDIAIS